MQFRNFKNYTFDEYGKCVNIKSGLELNGSINSNGYRQIQLREDGKSNFFRIHQIVAELYLGIKPDGDFVINHKDGNKTNNHKDNLEYISRKENTQHAFANNLMKNRKNEEHFNSKSEETIIRSFLEDCLNNPKDIKIIREKYLSKSFNKNIQYKILNNQTWKDIMKEERERIKEIYNSYCNPNSNKTNKNRVTLKDIPNGFKLISFDDRLKDYYAVNTSGTVFSRRSGKLLANVLNRNGYLKTSMKVDSETVTHFNHRLVAFTFLEYTDITLTVNHKDKNRQNNNIENLELLTIQENIKHANETSTTSKTYAK